MNAALAIIIGVRRRSRSASALRARRGRDMDLEQWSVGGRGFGAIFVFLLMAGRDLLDLHVPRRRRVRLRLGRRGLLHPRLRHARLRPVLLPAARGLALRDAAQAASRRPTSSSRKYDSRALGVLVSVVAVAAMIPYLALQLKGLGIIVSQTSYGHDLLDRRRSGSARSCCRSTSSPRASTARRGRRRSRTC